MMSRSARSSLLAVAGLALVAVAPAGAAATMQPGLWELSMTVTIDGKPQTVPAARECVSQKDIDQGDRILPRPAGACRLSNVRRTAERATYDLNCTENTIVTSGRADIAFAADRYDGKVDLVMADKGVSLPFTMAINARRLGDCAK